MSEQLHGVSCISNPLRWRTRIDLARRAIADWLKEDRVHITLVESAYGGRGYDLADLASDRVTHVPVRNYTMCWNKESCWNYAVTRLPPDANFIMFADADIQFQKPGWAGEVIQSLHVHPVTHPWSTCCDLGPNGELVQVHYSFGKLYREGQPVVPKAANWWKFDNGVYEYSHTGFAVAMTRRVFDLIGGVFDQGATGSGDHHFFYASVGEVDRSYPHGTHLNYISLLRAYQNRLLLHVGGNIGYVPSPIFHLHHGPKRLRGYNSRWGLFIKHNFDPLIDLKRNSFGIWDFSGNKPGLEIDWWRYLTSRCEDANVV